MENLKIIIATISNRKDNGTFCVYYSAYFCVKFLFKFIYLMQEKKKSFDENVVGKLRDLFIEFEHFCYCENFF